MWDQNIVLTILLNHINSLRVFVSATGFVQVHIRACTSRLCTGRPTGVWLPVNGNVFLRHEGGKVVSYLSEVVPGVVGSAIPACIAAFSFTCSLESATIMFLITKDRGLYTTSV